MLKPILFTIPLCIAIPMISHATVGGGQYIEFLGYEPTDKKFICYAIMKMDVAACRNFITISFIKLINHPSCLK